VRVRCAYEPPAEVDEVNGPDHVLNNITPSLKPLANLVRAERVYDSLRFGLLIEPRQRPDRLRRVHVHQRHHHLRPLTDTLNQNQKAHVSIGQPLLLASLVCHPLRVAPLELARKQGRPDAGSPKATVPIHSYATRGLSQRSGAHPDLLPGRYWDGMDERRREAQT
jgi:hypothetical protein